ncbi:MAG: universal stress protein [Candidatus Binatia bacterium]
MAELFRKILARVDFDELSLTILPYVRRLAQQDDATVYLLHFVTTLELDPHQRMYNPAEYRRGVGEEYRPGVGVRAGGGMEWTHEKMAKENLAKIAQEQLPGVRCEIVARMSDDQAADILKMEKELGVDLVAMATQGRTGMAHLLRGSVTEKVVRQSSCPVLSTRKGQELSAAQPLRKILVSVEADDKALDVLTYAGHLARQNDSTVYLLHTVPTEKIDLKLSDIYRPADGSEPSLVYAEKAAKGHLEAIAQERLSGVRYEPVVHVSGNPGKTILEVEQDLGADLLVMATHGFTGAFHMLMGSLTERMVRESLCPVLSLHRRYRS